MRLDAEAITVPVAIAAYQDRLHSMGSVLPPLVARVVSKEAASVGVTLFAPGEPPLYSQMCVGPATTVGDVRLHLRDLLGVPFEQQRWLSLLRKSPQQRRSLDSTAAPLPLQYDTLYDVMLDDTRTLGSYGSVIPGAEIHVALGPSTTPLGAVATCIVPLLSDFAGSMKGPDCSPLGHDDGETQHPACRAYTAVSQIVCRAYDESSGYHTPHCIIREGRVVAQAAAIAASPPWGACA